jgi:hypothetical protein
MSHNKERRLVDAAESVVLDAPLLVRASRMAFVVRCSADAQTIEVREDFYHNGRRLDDVWPSGGKKYQYYIRSFKIGGLVLAPWEELIIGREVGLEVHTTNRTIDAERASLYFDRSLKQAFKLDAEMSDRHIALTALPDGNVNVMDLSSGIGTFLQRL